MTKMFVTLSTQRYTLVKYDIKKNGSKVPSRECTVQHILNVDDIEPTHVALTVHNDTRTTHVTTTSDHDNVTSIELDIVGDLALLEIEADSVVDLDQGIGVTDGTAIVGDDVGDALVANGDLADLEELIGGLLGGDAVDGEPALDIVKETEVLVGLRLDR